MNKFPANSGQPISYDNLAVLPVLPFESRLSAYIDNLPPFPARTLHVSKRIKLTPIAKQETSPHRVVKNRRVRNQVYPKLRHATKGGQPENIKRPPSVGAVKVSEDEDEGEDTNNREQRRQAKSKKVIDHVTGSLRWSGLWGLKVPIEWFADDRNMRSDKEILAIQKASWKSPVYLHFKSPTIEGTGRKACYLFRCKKEPSVVIRKNLLDMSTLDLRNHVEERNKGKCTAGMPKAAPGRAQRSTYTPSRFRVAMAQLVASGTMSLKDCTCPMLAELFKIANPQIEIPAPKTIARDLVNFHHICKHAVANFLQNLPGLITIGLDSWKFRTSPGRVAVVAHFTVNDELKKLLLDYAETTEDLTIEQQGEQLVKTANEYGIANKVNSIIGDGTPHIDVICDHVKLHFPRLRGRESRVKCFAYAIQGLTRALLKHFSSSTKGLALHPIGRRTEGESPLDENDHHRIGPQDKRLIALLEEDVNAAIQDVNRELEANDEPPFVITQDMIATASELIPKLSGLVECLHHDARTQIEFKKILSASNPEVAESEMGHIIPYRTVVCWNSACATMKAMVKLEKPVRQLLAMPGLDLEKYELNDTQWLMMSNLLAILKLPIYSINKVSQTNRPMIHHVVPWIAAIQIGLDIHSTKEQNHPMVRFACAVAVKVFNKYYSNTDDAWIIRTAMVFHPSMRNHSVYQRYCPTEWKEKAIALAQKVWKEYYAPEPDHGSDASSDDDDEFYRDALAEVYGDASKVPITLQLLRKKPIDELESYLDEFLDSNLIDRRDVSPLVWWSARANIHPNLARMAHDVLTTPITSMDIDKAFKQDPTALRYRRHELDRPSVRASLIYGDWIKSELPDVVPKKLLECFVDRSKDGAKNGRLMETIAQAVQTGNIDEVVANLEQGAYEDDERDGDEDPYCSESEEESDGASTDG